jgi:hypothetical protein
MYLTPVRRTHNCGDGEHRRSVYSVPHVTPLAAPVALT